MILSVSRRTDIPNYYSDWFFNRIEEGFLYVRNPMNFPSFPFQIQHNLIHPHPSFCMTGSTHGATQTGADAFVLHPPLYFLLSCSHPLGSLKELFSDTIRLNTSASSSESFASTQKKPLRTNWKLS